MPGLRREELAALAGVSADYIMRLEQGRDHRPSEKVLEALARALQLDDDARAHMLALSRSASHAARPRDRAVEHVRPEVQALLDGWSTPAFIHGRHLDVLASNAAARALTRVSEPGTNMLRSMFLVKEEYERYEDLEFTLARTVALLPRRRRQRSRRSLSPGPDRGALAQERRFPLLATAKRRTRQLRAASRALSSIAPHLRREDERLHAMSDHMVFLRMNAIALRLRATAARCTMPVIG